MELLKKAETTLADLFKGAPKVSNEVKNSIVSVLPWLALLGGIFQLWGAYNVFRWADAANDVNNAVNEFYRAIGASQVVQNRWTAWVWIAIVFSVVQGLLLLLAFPKLQKKAKAGWDLLLLSGLLGIVYAIFSLFFDGYGYGGGGFAGLVIGLLISAVVFWLLFSVRDKYTGASLSTADLNPTHKK